ncbi:MAG: NAD-dependent epimerase/dehydratase family protein [Desulfobacteraceae bacterium]|nr:MAG: NAD-dependent epimerase/dehydratase family protein [Desulfobacteraceae bacterium]
MKILLTGATGFVGKTLTRHLLAAGHQVTALLLYQDDPSAAAGARIVFGDITRPETLTGRMDGHDALIHLAGAVGYGQSLDTCRRLNRDGTRHVAAAALRAGVGRFIHMSSVSVYGRVSGQPITERFLLKKIGDPYGDTKIDAEHALAEIAGGGAMAPTIVRPTMIYGPGDRLFLPKVVENLAGGKARIIGKGTHAVNAIHVEDVARFIAMLLERPRTAGEVYNLTHPDNPSWIAFLAMLSRSAEVQPPRGHIPYPVAFAAAALMEWRACRTGQTPRLTRYAVRNVGRPYDYVTRKMQQELGFYPEVSLFEGIEKIFGSKRRKTNAA